MHQEYPHMLYKAGVVGRDYMVVADPGEEAAAKKDGYFRAGESGDEPAAKPAKKAAK